MPGQRAKGVTVRNFSVEDVLWEAAVAKAGSEKRSVADVLREALRAYVKS